MTLTEALVEEAALGWFQELGYAVLAGPRLAPGEPAAERDAFSDVVLMGRLREAIRQLNPAIPEEAREEALRKLLRLSSPSTLQTTRMVHRLLREGLPVNPPGPMAASPVIMYGSSTSQPSPPTIGLWSTI